MQPRVAIPLPTSADHEYNRLNWPVFARCVREAGGIPVEVRLDLNVQDLAQLARTCNAFLLPGSPADVDPTTYGQARDPASAPADPQREATDRLLLEFAEHQARPLLGICFGAQMLNVYRGGILVQDLAPMPVNHAASRAVLVAHTVTLAPGSLLAAFAAEEIEEVEGSARVSVNSSHHQAIGVAGTGLCITARCPQDGVIEAIEPHPATPSTAFLLGVQWHPERTFDTSRTSRALFHRLVQTTSK